MNIKIRAYDKKQKSFVKDLHNIRVRKNGEIYSQNKAMILILIKKHELT